MLRIDYKRLSFLVIDDNPATRHIVRTMLSAFGVREIAVAADGPAGIKLAFARAPDMVLLDWTRPGPGGLELVRLLRAPASPIAQVPIIMLSSRRREAEVVAARDAGVTEFLIKPFTAEILHQRIAGVLAKPRAFVDSATFRGPDRRRRSSEPPEFERRGSRSA
jgi:DNA-binding response OmpR family regulator